jgi:hypothetical protein
MKNNHYDFLSNFSRLPTHKCVRHAVAYVPISRQITRHFNLRQDSASDEHAKGRPSRGSGK